MKMLHEYADKWAFPVEYTHILTGKVCFCWWEMICPAPGSSVLGSGEQHVRLRGVICPAPGRASEAPLMCLFDLLGSWKWPWRS